MTEQETDSLKKKLADAEVRANDRLLLLNQWQSDCEKAEVELRELKRAFDQPIAWVPEDELPDSLPTSAYNQLFPHSRVDGIRFFPIFGPSKSQ